MSCKSVNILNRALIIGLVVVLGSCGRSARYYFESGERFFADHAYEEAALNYRKAIQKNSNYTEAFEKLGLAELQQGLFVEALSALKRASELVPQNDRIQVEYADVCLSNYLLNPQRPKYLYDQTTRIANNILKHDPNSVEGLRLLGSLQLSDRKLNDALATFQRANTLQPLKPEIVFPLVGALEADGQHQAAERLALDLVAREPKFMPAYAWLYDVYATDNRMSDAERILLAMSNANPEDGPSKVTVARHYYALGNAIETDRWMNALLNSLKVPDRFVLAGDFYASIKAFDKAHHCFELGVTAYPKDRILYEKRIAGTYLAQHKTTEALNVLDQILKETPDDAEARIGRASILIDGSPAQLTSALEECRRVLAKHPTEARAKYVLGLAYLKQGDIVSARRSLTEAAENHDYVEPRIALAELADQRREFNVTLRYADGVLAAVPKHFKARLLRASALTETAKLDAAQIELASLAADYPNSAEVKYRTGVLRLAQNKYADAVRILSPLTERAEEDPDVLAALVTAYLGERQPERALQLMISEKTKRPTSERVRALLATTATTIGKLDVAKDELTGLVEAYPLVSSYHLRLSEVYQMLGDTPAALTQLRQAQQLSPQDSAIAGRLALILQATGSIKEASAFYDKSIALSNADPILLNNKAYFLAETSTQLDEALRLAQIAAQKAPDNPAVRDTLGWVYIKRNNTDSALQIFSSLVRQYPAIVAFRYHLAYVFFRMGERNKARAELSAALSNKPTDQERFQIRALISQL